MLNKIMLGAALLLGCLGLSHAQAAELHDAVRAGDLARVKKLAAGGADLNARDDNGDTPLALAMLGGHATQELETLLDESVKTNKPLQLPVSARHDAIARLLISRGATFSAAESGIVSPLGLAALTGNRKMVDFLLARKADVNLGSPLLFALLTGNDDIARKLVARGANVQASHGNFPSPLAAAAARRDAAMINLLVGKGADVNARNDEGDTVLHAAVRAKNLEMVELLLAKGADINARNNDGDSALMLAELAHAPEMAHLLVDKGANVNLADDSGATALIAAATASADEVQYLLAKGADANVKLVNGMGPLFWAANKEVAALFIARGADVNARAQRGSTALYHAAIEGRADVVELLLARGADANAKLDNGGTPLFAAANAAIAAMLIDKGADVKARANDGKTPLFSARNKDVAALLIDKGADVKDRAANGDTPLHAAAERHADDTAQLLLDRGAEANARNNEGKTPLHLAVDAGDRKLVPLLLARGAEANARGGNGMTPLFFARDKAMANTLIKAGADVNAKADDGLTPLFYACDRDVAALLAAAGARETPLPFREPAMVAIPAGGIDLPATAEDSLPARHADIARFEMSKTEITQAEFRAVMGYNPSSFKGANLPVDSVYWSEMQEYINRLNQKTGKQYRFPTEAEWQYACLANARTQYCGGDDPNEVAWWGGRGQPAPGNSGGATHPVGSKKPNAFGLYDMSGNLAEWTVTPGVAYADSGRAEPGQATRAPLRGGSWLSGEADLRATARSLDYILPRSTAIGIRLARTAP